jgi:hypothetical protein
LLLVEAERCRGAAAPRVCGETLLLDLWLLDDGRHVRVLQKRGPLASDPDFKSGSGLWARAWLEVGGQRFVLVDEVGYVGRGPFLAEVLPTGVRPVELRPAN